MNSNIVPSNVYASPPAPDSGELEPAVEQYLRNDLAQGVAESPKYFPYLIDSIFHHTLAAGLIVTRIQVESYIKKQIQRGHYKLLTISKARQPYAETVYSSEYSFHILPNSALPGRDNPHRLPLDTDSQQFLNGIMAILDLAPVEVRARLVWLYCDLCGARVDGPNGHTCPISRD